MCRLGKRKASDRADEAAQEPRHSKRAAVDTSAPDDAQPLKPDHAGGCQDVSIRGQDTDTRGQKRPAEEGNLLLYQNTATDQPMRQEAKLSAMCSQAHGGELCASSQSDHTYQKFDSTATLHN